MAVFILETEAASSAASSINSLASEVANISSSVSGYDTSCEDGFNFAGAKGVIAGNIEACSVKIQNTAKVIESVVSSHTQLQNSLKFTDPAAASNTNGTNTNGTNTNGTNTNGTKTGGNNNYGGYSGGGSYYGGGGGGGGTGAGADIPIATPTTTLQEKIKSKIGVITSGLSAIGYAFADSASVSEETKKLLKDGLFKYDENGYAKIGDRFVIACDSTYANIGDVIRFTQKDGTTVECVVGITTVSEKYKNVVNFIVDSKAQSIQAIDTTKNLLTNSQKIENIGSLSDIRNTTNIGEVIAKALQSGTASVSTTGTTTTGTTTTGTSTTGTNVTTAPDAATAVASVISPDTAQTTTSTTTTTNGTTTIETPATGGIATQTIVIKSDDSDTGTVQV